MKRLSLILFPIVCIFAAWSLLAVCGACGHMPDIATRQPSHGVAAQYAAAVAIDINCTGLTVGRGSGVIVGPRHVLTAHHVAQGAADAEAILGVPCFLVVTAIDGSVHVMRSEAMLERVDIARIELMPDSTTVLPYTRVAVGPRPAVGDTVCIAAAIPRHGRKCGEVQPRSDPAQANDILHNAVTEPGNSGSGLYDSRGRLVGIVTVLLQAGNGQIIGGGASSLASRSWLVSP